MRHNRNKPKTAKAKLEALEATLQAAFIAYKRTKSLSAELYDGVSKVCRACLLKIGARSYEIDELVDASAVKMLEVLKRKVAEDGNFVVKKWSNFVYLYCLGILYNKQRVFETSMLSLEEETC